LYTESTELTQAGWFLPIFNTGSCLEEAALGADADTGAFCAGADAGCADKLPCEGAGCFPSIMSCAFCAAAWASANENLLAAGALSQAKKTRAIQKNGTTGKKPKNGGFVFITLLIKSHFCKALA
jgi:hypothetical protein